MKLIPLFLCFLPLVATDSKLQQMLYGQTWLLHTKGSTLGWAGKFVFRKNGTLEENHPTGEGQYAVTGRFSLTGDRLTIDFRRFSTYETYPCVNGPKPRSLQDCLKETREKHEYQKLSCVLVENKDHIKYAATLECSDGSYLASEKYRLPLDRKAIFADVPVITTHQEKRLVRPCYPYATIADESSTLPDLFENGPLPAQITVQIVAITQEKHRFKNSAEKWILGQIWTEPTWQPAIWLPLSCFNLP